MAIGRSLEIHQGPLKAVIQISIIHQSFGCNFALEVLDEWNQPTWIWFQVGTHQTTLLTEANNGEREMEIEVGDIAALLVLAALAALVIHFGFAAVIVKTLQVIAVVAVAAGIVLVLTHRSNWIQ